MRHMSDNRQWKVVDERYSGNVFTDDHWYSTHIPRIVRVRTTQTTQKIRKTAQYCANFYAKPSFELLKPGIAQSTDTANIGAQLRRFHVRKPDEMRKSLMYHVRLEICAWFMRLREFWAVWLGLNECLPGGESFKFRFYISQLVIPSILIDAQAQITNTTTHKGHVKQKYGLISIMVR